MALNTTRLGTSDDESHCMEVTQVFAVTPASCLLWHLARMPGLQVIAKKSWVMTDDFEAYFMYKNRLFLMQTPFTNVWISMLGKPEDERLFFEVEAHVRQYSWTNLLLAPLAIARFFFKPFNPRKKLLAQFLRKTV